MLLAVDIGNTNIDFGVFEGLTLLTEFRVTTDTARTVDEYEAMISTLLAKRIPGNLTFKRCIISSVVPPVTDGIYKMFKSWLKVEPLLVGPGVKTGIEIRIDDPRSLGSDRIVNAVAVKKLFGSPSIVVDFGTATTFDYLGKDGAYEGGIISPGPLVSLEALVDRTAKLPKIDFTWPRSVIGKGTIPAMQSGTALAYCCLVDGVIDRMLEEVGDVPHIVSTGGLGEFFSKHSKRIKKFHPFLTLEGLRLISELNI